MRTFHRTLMELTIANGSVVREDGEPFDRVAYSHFKYGYVPPAREYGRDLAAFIYDELRQVCGADPIRIVSAPYKFLPTASHAVAQSLCEALGTRSIMSGLESPSLLPLYKARVGSSSYAKSSEQDRLKSLATLGLHVDESLVPGSHILVVDDIKITGSAQRATAQYLEPLRPASIWYLHAACLSQTVAATHPGLEDELNQTVEHRLEVILQQCLAGEFQLNTRVLRHMLESDAQDFQLFAMHAPVWLLEQMHRAAVGNGLVYYRRYPDNVATLAHMLGSPSLITH